LNKGGRPIKEGLDFMRIDVHMDTDDKIALIEEDAGDAAFGVVIKLLMQIYSTNGYYYPWTDREEMLFCKKRNVSRELCKIVVESALKWRLFDPGMFEEYGILTSRGIQKRYFFAARSRAKIEIDKKLLLLDVGDYISEDKILLAEGFYPPQNLPQEGNYPTQNPHRTEQQITGQNSTEQNTSDAAEKDIPYLPLAKHLAERITDNDENYFRGKDRQRIESVWATDIRLLVERDGRDKKVVESVIDWCQGNDFWKANILSASKLRKKFPTLLLQMNRKQPTNGGPRASPEEWEKSDPEEYYKNEEIEF
jgi:hypothetical protein